MTTWGSGRPVPGWLSDDDCVLDRFWPVVEQSTSLAAYPCADDVQQSVLVYGRRFRDRVTTVAGRRAVQVELARALTDGPGAVVFRGAFPDTSVVDHATDAFSAMIAAEKARGVAGGDHFAKPGANDRLWGALDKFAVREPELFADYYANGVIALIAEAWLGPNYQVTSQINVVNPGGAAQVSHRDYHLGFMSLDQACAYPAQVHQLSPALTLQGAVAHCDMPIESGPTMYLPYSQKYPAGYLAFHKQEFIEYFNANYVQLPLRKGDAVFFNPAVFHAAGTNRTTDTKRMANLLQISSAFGRAMETVDRLAMCEALYPVLLLRKAEGVDETELRTVIATAAEGYASPPTSITTSRSAGGHRRRKPS